MKSVQGRSGYGLSLTVLAALPLSLAIPPLTLPARAQTGAIVQSTPPAVAVERLNQNLTRLSRQPTDMDALIGAGTASYELGDAQAANGFFTRANLVNPRSGKAKLGLALVSVALKQPREAAAYFDEAAALGEGANGYLAERALTYDLTGQQDKAQRDYVQALQAAPGDSDLIRAYAVSLGISGKVDLAEAQLRPLLFKSDRAAWRDRTMILAMNGRTAEARKIAQTIMPRSLADGMEPYLVRMGSLTAAQKAVATHYGQFPSEGLRLATVTSPPAALAPARVEAASRRASRDRQRAAPATATAAPEDNSLLAAMPRGDMPPAMVQPIPSATPARVASSARAGVDDDDPDGYTPAERRRLERRGATTASARPGVRAATGAASSPASPSSYPAPTAASVQPVPMMVQPIPSSSAVASAAPGPVRIATAAPPSSAPRPVQGPSAGMPASAPVPAPSPAMVQAVPIATAQPGGAPAPLAAPNAPQPGFSVAPVAGPAAATPMRTLAAIMADIQVREDAERAAAAPAVDLDEIARMQAARRKAVADKARKDAAAKAKAEADARLKAEAKAEAEEKARIKANPARVWIQIATGRDPAALAFDMRRLRKTYSVLASESASTAEWGATRRLLVGPYASVTKAKAVLSDLKKAGSDGFVWQSEAGETIAPLSGK